MEAETIRLWRDAFERAAEVKAEAIRIAALGAQLDWLDRKALEKQQAKAKEEERDRLAEREVTLATHAQIVAFETQLDDYDTRTVTALMKNGEALDRVRHDLKQMLDDAHVLPDGRRVFKTEDGHRVFDEHGAELSSKVIDPDAIQGPNSSWESFKARKDEETGLIAERQTLFDFQAKLDHARERVGKGDITKHELDDLGADLKASAPPAVRLKPDTSPARLEADLGDTGAARRVQPTIAIPAPAGP